MKKKAKIPEPTIARLPVYFRCLMDLKNNNVTIVSSEDISLKAGVKASQFRKDMSYFGEFGIQGLGYPVLHMIERIASIMQLDKVHTVVVVGVGNLGGSKGLHTAIFYDAVRFFPSAEGTFWFSDAPDIPGSRGWGNIIPRTCTWMRLIEKESGQPFYFYNVHLDHISQRSRKNSVVLLTDFIHSRPSADPYILTGDFNAREKSAPIQYLKGKIPLRIKTKGSVFNSEPLMDTFRVRYPNVRNVATFHGFRRYFFRFKLDYIFVPSSVRVQDAKIIQPQWKKYYPSDHFPLFTHIDLSVIPAAANSGAFIEKAMNDE